MTRNRLLENLDSKIRRDIPIRRYSLSDMISESYKSLYECEQGTNLQRIAESHLDDVRNNPSDIDRLSRQLCKIKELIRMTESGEIKDKDLVPKTYRDTVKPRKERALDLQEAADPEDKVEDTDVSDDVALTDEEVEELTKHLEEIRRKKTNKNPEESLEEAAESAYKVYQLVMDVAFPSNRDPSSYGLYAGQGNAQLFKAISKTLGTTGLEMAGDTIEVEGEVTDTYVDNDYEFFTDSKKVTPGVKESCKRARSLEEDEDPDISLQDRVMTVLADAIHELGVNPDSVGGSLDELVYNIARLMTSTNESAPVWSRYHIVNPEGETIDSYTDRKDAEEWVTQLYKDGDYKKGELKVVDSQSKNESKSYDKLNLSEFNKKSSSKAFVKTFKKLDKKLHEGIALTRQESIALYKAANSAMTHLSVELEHNPGFLKTFNECTTLLSADVSKLLESMKNGKAPSKANMKSLAKFSETLLREDEEEDIEDTPIEDEESEYVSDEDTSEESEEFDQEYADARVELHKELADEHADSEDPDVQNKLEQDKEEVTSLPGITDEQVAELEGEESNEDTSDEEEAPEEDATEDGEVEESEDLDLGDDDITDEELAELKKHLREMRKIKKNN